MRGRPEPDRPPRTGCFMSNARDPPPLGEVPMAKKKAARKRSDGSPSTVLVVFLVFFILLSIGLGVWGYYGYSGQKDAVDRAKKEKETTANAQKAMEFYEFIALWSRAAARRGPEDDGEKTKWKDRYQQYKDNKYAGVPNYEKLKPVVDTMLDEDAKMLAYVADQGRFDANLRGKVAALEKDLETKKGELDAALVALEKAR